jgi:argininosuccinate lyase
MSLTDTSRFPAESYKAAVLSPLFEEAKAHYYGPLQRINRAHGVMLAEQGILTRPEAGRILAALAEIDAELDLAALRYTGQFEDLFFVVEDALCQRVGKELGGRLHTGRSRNDIDVTQFKMVLKGRLDRTITELSAVIRSLLTVAEREKATLVVAYTHGQPAQPTRFGHYLAALAEVLLRDLNRLLNARDDADLCSMGAAAITTTGFPLNRERMADLLGFADIQLNSYGCIAAADYLMSAYGALKGVFLNLGRFIQDMNVWSGFEVGHLYVPNAFVQISSIMPQKRNPVPIEHMRLQLSHGAGHCDTVLLTLHNTPFTDMNDAEGPTQNAGYAAFAVADRILPLFADFIASVRINEAKVRRHIDESCLVMTEVADSLVRLEGLSFRQGHEVASKLSRHLVDGGIPASALPPEDFVRIFSDVAGRAPVLPLTEIQALATPEHFIEVRTLPGGPGRAALAGALEIYHSRLAALLDRHAVALTRETTAAERLTAAVVALIAEAA